MKTEKTEMVSVEFTKAELEQIIINAIKEKHPYLMDESVWAWDDFFIDKRIADSDFADDKMAVFALYSRIVSMVEKPLDNDPRVVYVRVNEVCR